jgi:hypothetical protein
MPNELACTSIRFESTLKEPEIIGLCNIPRFTVEPTAVVKINAGSHTADGF